MDFVLAFCTLFICLSYGIDTPRNISNLELLEEKVTLDETKTSQEILDSEIEVFKIQGKYKATKDELEVANSVLEIKEKLKL